MTTDKDPQLEHAGRPDPGPGTTGGEAPSAPGDAPTPTASERSEAAEPEGNRFPDDGETHQESG